MIMAVTRVRVSMRPDCVAQSMIDRKDSMNRFLRWPLRQAVRAAHTTSGSTMLQKTRKDTFDLTLSTR
jgi:hypothetical protein